MKKHPGPETGIRAWLGRAFLMQIALISITAVMGVFLAGALLEGVLIRAALDDEVNHFWSQRQADSSLQLPNTRNLRGYLDDDAPAELKSLSLGYHEWMRDGLEFVVYVTERDHRRLYLVFDRTNVSRLAAYYGLVPLAAVLLVLYVSTWLGFRRVRRAVSPMISLARKVRELDADTSGIDDVQSLQVPVDADEEVRELTDALLRYSQRLAHFLERERQFTRDASHELRSPLTVILMAVSILLEDPDITGQRRRTALRIQRAAHDMEELTNAFLLLARETETGLPMEAICLNDLIADEVDRARTLASDKPITAEVRGTNRLFLEAPEKVLSILLGNLLRNAFSYTEAGEVVVEISAGKVTVRDTGVGMAADKIEQMFRPFVRDESNSRSGYGVGLSIVRRLSDRFGWPISIVSQPGVGTTVEIRFPKSRIG
ncbi:MAG TPA: HAMP domain-containing sensor histidine kinase [Steroidobacteraceae bacterium]|nr:HAMP domain-containing sensor histidine kinase [Steroidobacteraceae bacterium]